MDMLDVVITSYRIFFETTNEKIMYRFDNRCSVRLFAKINCF